VSNEGIMDKKKIEKAVRMILESIGEDPERPGISKTPERFARMCEEIFAGMREKAADVLKTLPSEKYRDMVLVRDIPFYSVCEHHLVPFFGKVHIAYVPSGRMTGLSKFARLVEAFSKRLQVQERITRQIADAFQKKLKPEGVFVMIEAVHLCMVMRGIKKERSSVVTVAARGVFKKSEKQAEVLNLIKK